MAVGNCNFNTIYHNKLYFLENFIHFVISCNLKCVCIYIIHIYRVYLCIVNCTVWAAVKSNLKLKKKSPPCPRVSTEREHVSSQELGSRYRRKSQVSEPWNHFLLESQLPSL